MAELIEGVDYHLFYLDFANRANPALTVLNDDGTADIYLNTLFPPERLARELEHELRHLKDQHFHAERISIELAERQANGEQLDLIGAARARGNILCFHSPGAFAAYVQRLAEQRGVDLRRLRPQDQIIEPEIPGSAQKRSERVKPGRNGHTDDKV